MLSTNAVWIATGSDSSTKAPWDDVYLAVFR